MKKTITILLDVTVRGFTKKEATEEGLEWSECKDAAAEFTGDFLADALVDYLMEGQDELLAGSNSFVKITDVTASRSVEEDETR